jgi:hypothetical protein
MSARLPHPDAQAECFLSARPSDTPVAASREIIELTRDEAHVVLDAALGTGTRVFLRLTVSQEQSEAILGRVAWAGPDPGQRGFLTILRFAEPLPPSALIPFTQPGCSR